MNKVNGNIKNDDPPLETARKTILIVDDEAIIAAHQAEVLRGHGFKTLTTFGGETAVRMIEENQIDLVLMDIDLGPGRMDGTETAENILAGHDVPIVFLTNHTEKTIIEKVRGITRYGYILKNCSELVKLECVLRAFELFEARQEIKKINLERKNAEKSLVSANALLEATLNSIPDIIGIQEIGHKIIRYNSAGYKLLNATPESIRGKRCFELIGRTEPCPNCATTKCYQSKQPETMERYVEEMGIWFDTRTYPILDDEGNVVKVVEHLRDVTEKKLAAEKLRESEEKYRSIIDGGLESSSIGVFILSSDFKVVWINKAVEYYFGILKEDTIGQDKRELILRNIKSIFEQPEEFKRKVFATYDDNTYIENFECHVLPGPQREDRWLEHWSQPIITGHYAGGRMEYYTDITKQKRSELALRKVLAEKEYLMKEINHRTKNNLAMISSLIYLKDSALGSLVDLSDLAHQIDAIRIIHEKLNQENIISEINIRSYFQELLRTIFHSFTLQPVDIRIEVPDIKLFTRTAIPLGLILNEIATNAIKHGFNAGTEAVFTVNLEKTAAERFTLTLSNSGNSFPDDIDLDNPQTLGLRLISALVSQLCGEIRLRKSPHPVFLITFPYTPTP